MSSKMSKIIHFFQALSGQNIHGRSVLWKAVALWTKNNLLRFFCGKFANSLEDFLVWYILYEKVFSSNNFSICFCRTFFALECVCFPVLDLSPLRNWKKNKNHCKSPAPFVKRPGWSPRDNQRWTALYQRFIVFQRWFREHEKHHRGSALFRSWSALIFSESALFRIDKFSAIWLKKTSSESALFISDFLSSETLSFQALIQRTWKTSALISSVSELISFDFLWIGAVQNWKSQRCFKESYSELALILRHVDGNTKLW